jgi:hypothetical protein
MIVRMPSDSLVALCDYIDHQDVISLRRVSVYMAVVQKAILRPTRLELHLPHVFLQPVIRDLATIWPLHVVFRGNIRGNIHGRNEDKNGLLEWLHQRCAGIHT